MAFSTFAANLIGEVLLRGASHTGAGTLYLSWHSAEPDGAGSDEISGNGYIRKEIAFDAFVAGISQNTGPVTQAATGGNMTSESHWGIWDDVAAGNFIYGGPLDTTITVLEDEIFTASAGDLDVTNVVL